MKKILLTSVIALLCISANSQITFNEAIGGSGDDEAIYAKATTDGGYAIVGWTTSFGAGNWDIYLVKTDSTGEILWSKTYGGPADEVDCSLQQTTDGGFIITARTNSYGAGSADVYLIKTDVNGNLLWTKTIGGSAWEEGHFVIQNNDGSYVHCGYTISYGAGNQDIYLIKNDPNGNVLWTKTFGGSGTDFGHFIQPATNGGYILAGVTNSFGAGGFDYYVVKTDTLGNVQWSKTYGGVGDDQGWEIDATTDGGYIVSGFSNSFGAGGDDVYLVKIDVNGNVQWSKTYGGILDDESYAVQQTSDGGYIISGETKSFGLGDADIYLIKTDANGNAVWSKTFGGVGDDGCQSVEQTNDGGYLMAGYTNSFGSGSWDFSLIKTDAQGNSSGCNETNPVSIENTVTSITVAANSSTISSSGALSSSPVSFVGSGGTVSPCSPTAVAENNSADEFVVFPNPASQELNIVIHSSSRDQNTIRMINVLGEEVYKETFSGQLKINTSDFSQGVYFVEITDAQQHVVESRKVVISHN